VTAVTDFSANITAIRAQGEASNGLVRLTVDGTGEITELVIDPKAMRMSSEDLASAVQAAHRDARAGARTAVQHEAAQVTQGLGSLSSLLESVGADAQRRMADFARAADDIASRIDRH
jgi:DNA-binding protein YbaB